jgi:calcineurin-like phosphoesterase family protein
MRFFTSDLHLGHSNIIKYASRPFADVPTMNEALINNFNSCVTKDDITYFVGDVVMGPRKENLKLVSRLNGKKILILGNHDYPFDKPDWTAAYLEAGFKSVHMVMTLDGAGFSGVGGSIRLQHFPVLEATVQDHEDDARFNGFRLASNGSLHVSGDTHLKE